MTRRNLIVLKFGSSVLRGPGDLDAVVSEIYRHVRAGRRVVAVVSALGSTTDDLLAEARAIAPDGDETAIAALLATGELRSAAILHLALSRDGVRAALFDHHRLGLRTSGPLLHAAPGEIGRAMIDAALADHDVVVAPGFVGVHHDGRTSLLGRGGSDLTALVLADRLEAGRCVLIKDVDGLYERDPRLAAVEAGASWPRRFARVTYGRTLQLESGLVQDDAVAWARQAGRTFEIAAINVRRGTLVGTCDSRPEPAAPRRRPVRLALLGCGNVGRVVLERIRRRSEFDIVGVAVRRLAEHRAAGIVPRELLCDADALAARSPDVLIELSGGIEPARAHVEAALRRGAHVITANKDLLARHGPELEALAARAGVSLRSSAAVGGGAPMLEAVRRIARRCRIHRLTGVLNGTVSFILAALSRGESFDSAVADARARGLAEADVARDLSGLDAACKLILLARCAFGVELPLSAIELDGLDAGSVTPGRHQRQVASCVRRGNGLDAAIRIEPLPPGHPLWSDAPAGNTLLIEHEDGRAHIVRGIGAGCPPTALSVVADLLDIERHSRPAVNSRRGDASPQEVLS